VVRSTGDGVEFRNGAILEIATNAAVPGCQQLEV
jgi:hypothetical protein